MPKPWAELGVSLHEELQKGIESLNFPTMTPVQAAAIPQLVKMKDIVAEAVTGSGKTLAFLIPLLEILKRREERLKKHDIGALIISPTRELAMQTMEVLKQLLAYVSGMSHLVLVGGNSVEEDLNTFKCNGGNIIICTPGRFEDVISRNNDLNWTASLRSLEVLILDEADRLLDYGFRKSIDTILSYLPRQRRTGLFSATQTKEVEDLIRAGLRNPVLVSVNSKAEYSTPEELKNYFMLVNNNNKLAALLSFLAENDVRKALIFLPTCATVDYWFSALPHVLNTKLRMPVFGIHGKMKGKRKKIMQKFKESDMALLLCTDVLSRGIDIPEVDWVLQWDPPASASAFVHRVGRTARQGQQGSSLIFLLDTEETYVNFIEKNQRVVLHKFNDTSSSEKCAELVEMLHDLQRKDRDLMEKATRAFVSHIRAYSKHECSFLLRVKEMPFGSVASSYGLLQMPKMPELKNVDLSNFTNVQIDIDTIPYRDKIREAIRQKKLEVYKSTGMWPGRNKKIVKKATEAWSVAKQKKMDRKERKLKRKQTKESQAAGQAGGKKKKNHGITEEDLLELQRDIALLKKIKKKKISEEEFDKEFGI